ncbi:MAG: hypothetical protein L3J65_10195 [Robiginitomaculum sp.]|nr:hypothetical protein [Robiginitomaculum sp.]
MRVFILSALMVLGFSTAAFAQEDEIVVTGTRISAVSASGRGPGITVEKKGDFLLLQVTIENDSRELKTRLVEMDATIKNMLEAAKANPDITLSLVGKGNLVRSMNLVNYRSNLVGGRRPDTSMAHFKVKTNIPENMEEAFKLSASLAEFVEGVEEVGRTQILENESISVSILNPSQHRDEVRLKIISEINTTIEALGGNYRAIISGLDGPVKWARSGDFNLAFYMDYSYEIIPASLTTYEQ